MPYRKVVLAQDQFYHVFNRGVASLPIFHSPGDYKRLIKLISYYRFANTPISFSRLMKLPIDEKQQILEFLEKENNLQVEILAFCFIPNHLHLLLKQISNNGIKAFMGNVQNGYAKYLNIKSGRAGPLFQSTFKAVRIETDKQLLHVSRYIHLNPSTSYLVEIDKLAEYPWSSLQDYINDSASSLIFQGYVLGLFKSREKYKDFIFDQAQYQRELAGIKHLTFE